MRWNFVYQRPQHLLSRVAAYTRVLFVEEPLPGERRMLERSHHGGVDVVVPRLPERDLADPALTTHALQLLLDGLLTEEALASYVLWYYTPMALPWSRHLSPRAVVYDCMDELSGFAGAPVELRAREQELLGRAHLVTTGGRSLFDAKRQLHRNVHCFPSSVDVAHFAQARRPQVPPADQADIPRPRLGFAGVIDERLDRELVAAVAALRSDWQFVFLGPVVKIPIECLPKAPNIHYLGMKPYAELPRYLAGWDVGLLPFARNEATRFISPTKTPEYLAAGLPVVSTSILDVVRPYGTMGLVRIADEPEAFVAAVEEALTGDRASHRTRADLMLAEMSWDRTVEQILRLLTHALPSEARPPRGDRPTVDGGAG